MPQTAKGLRDEILKEAKSPYITNMVKMLFEMYEKENDTVIKLDLENKFVIAENALLKD